MIRNTNSLVVFPLLFCSLNNYLKQQGLDCSRFNIISVNIRSVNKDTSGSFNVVMNKVFRKYYQAVCLFKIQLSLCVFRFHLLFVLKRFYEYLNPCCSVSITKGRIIYDTTLVHNCVTNRFFSCSHFPFMTLLLFLGFQAFMNFSQC